MVGQTPAGALKNPRKLAVQFMYAFVTDDEGVKVFDLADPINPKPLPEATIPLADAHGPLRGAHLPLRGRRSGRTCHHRHQESRRAEAAREVHRERRVERHAGDSNRRNQRLDVRPRGRRKKWLPRAAADLAGKRSGLHGFQPAAQPEADRQLSDEGPAVAISRGLDRDRVVDETGDQTVVFGRRGSRPFNEKEFASFLRHADGEFFRVEDVTNQDGQLQTNSGKVLVPTEKFQSEKPKPIQLPSRERLERRPASE